MANRLRAGIVDSTIGGEADERAFERARWAGFAGVEATTSRADLRGDRRLGSLRRAQAATGLAVSSLILDHHNLGGIADEQPEVAEQAAAEVRRAIEAAATLGADAILIPFFARAELRADADVERAAAAFRTLCPVAEAARVELLYEGPLPAPRVHALAEAVGSPAFGCYFDTANLVFRGLDPPTEIRALGDLVRRVHVKDARARKSDVHPGRGRVDFRECAAALEAIGFDGWLVFETPPGPPPLAARDLSFIRSVFPGLERQQWPRYGVLLDRPLAELEEGIVDAVQLAGAALDEALDDPSAATCAVDIAALGAYGDLAHPQRRAVDVARVARCLEAAAELGTYVVATGAGSLSDRGPWSDSPDNAGEEAWSALHASVEALVPVAAQHDVVLALEGSANTVLKTPSQLLRLFDEVPSPNLQLVADPYNFINRHLLPAAARVTEEYLELFEDRFVLAHLKDVAAGPEDTIRPEFGCGEFPQRPYLAFLRERRPDLPLLFEHLPLAHLPRAHERATELIGAT